MDFPGNGATKGDYLNGKFNGISASNDTNNFRKIQKCEMKYYKVSEK